MSAAALIEDGRIVADTVRVVKPKEPQALAGAPCELVDVDPGQRHRLGLSARRRIGHFSLLAVVAHFEALHEGLLARVRDRKIS